MHAAPTERGHGPNTSTSSTVMAGRNNIVNCPQCIPPAGQRSASTGSAPHGGSTSCVQCMNAPHGICAQCAASPQQFQHNMPRVSQQQECIMFMKSYMLSFFLTIKKPFLFISNQFLIRKNVWYFMLWLAKLCWKN